jgi:hypothetical protein
MSGTHLAKPLLSRELCPQAGAPSRAATAGSRAQRSLDGVAGGRTIASEERFGGENAPLFIVEMCLNLLTHTARRSAPTPNRGVER